MLTPITRPRLPLTQSRKEHQMTQARNPNRTRRTARLTAGIAAALLTLGVLPTTTANAVAPLPTPDGKSAVSAAASCYEIKVNTPSAPSGVYWLYTPALQAPEQFYCDQ